MLYTGTTDNAASKRLGKGGAFSPRTDAHWDTTPRQHTV